MEKLMHFHPLIPSIIIPPHHPTLFPSVFLTKTKNHYPSQQFPSSYFTVFLSLSLSFPPLSLSLSDQISPFRFLYLSPLSKTNILLLLLLFSLFFCLSTCFSSIWVKFSLIWRYHIIYSPTKQKEKKMSVDLASERVCYVHCNFCNTILAVSVPCSSMLTIVTVRCGHCANLLSVNMGALLQAVPPEDAQLQKQQTNCQDSNEFGSSSKSNKFSGFESSEHNSNAPRMPPIRPPEKRQRVPSAYNKFIKEEIQRIKASNPDISHREAFSTAAKNWAHFPHIHFGLKLDGNNK